MKNINESKQRVEKLIGSISEKLNKNAMGHTWKLNKDGSVDYFALDEGIHNGPVCTKCGYSFCHHCRSAPEWECDR